MHKELGPGSIFFHAARLYKEGNRYIVLELERAGLAGVVPSHGDILVQLFSMERCKMSQLARLIHRSKSTSTVLVEKLEKNGYVRREPDPCDQRGVCVSLTDKGRALQPVVEHITQGLDTLLRSRLTAREMGELDRLLKKSVQGPSQEQIFR